jgi:hypothetical protein
MSNPKKWNTSRELIAAKVYLHGADTVESLYEFLKDEKTRYGIGVMDVKGGTKQYPKAYVAWWERLKSILTKSYYSDVRIDSRWLRFSGFLRWYLPRAEAIKRFDLHIDKDISGHLVYGPDYVVLVAAGINLMFKHYGSDGVSINNGSSWQYNVPKNLHPVYERLGLKGSTGTVYRSMDLTRDEVVAEANEAKMVACRELVLEALDELVKIEDSKLRTELILNLKYVELEATRRWSK